MQAGDGGPFGAVVVRDGVVLATAHNEVLRAQDPTAHAEVLAIRRACAAVGSFSLQGATLFASCEPCPMCFGAALWARVDRVVYAGSRTDAAEIGFDDADFHAALAARMTDGTDQVDPHPPTNTPSIGPRVEVLLPDEGRACLLEWLDLPERRPY